MLANILICAFAAGVLVVCVWLICLKFLFPVKTKDVFFVLAATGSGQTMEQQCRAWLLLKNAGIIRRPLLIADAGLNSEGRCMAEVIKNLDTEIFFCKVEDLPKWIHTGV